MGRRAGEMVDAADAAHDRFFRLFGHAFDMTAARPGHEHIRHFSRGRNVVLFMLERLDTSDGTETDEDTIRRRLSPIQLTYRDIHAGE